MPVQKPIALDDSGTLTEIVPVTTSAGSGDAGKLLALNAAGQIDDTALPTVNSLMSVAKEAIPAGSLINLVSGGVRLADGPSGKLADGYANATAANGAAIKVTLREGLISGLADLTPGAIYFLGASGGLTATPPTTAGQSLQQVGRAKSATELSFNVGLGIKRA